VTTASAAAPRPSDHRVLIAGLFAVYLALLVWAVLWKLGVPSLHGGDTRAVKLVPFVAGDGYGVNSPAEMAANVALFVPFGLYLGMLVPRWGWGGIAAIAATVSIGLETAQYVLAVGSSDVTDVILNTAGAVTGLALLAVARRVLRKRTASVLTSVCAAGTVLALAAGAAFVTGPVRYGPPPGEVPHVRAWHG
jgi:glycopeptide antibiotics resistance protein